MKRLFSDKESRLAITNFFVTMRAVRFRYSLTVKKEPHGSTSFVGTEIHAKVDIVPHLETGRLFFARRRVTLSV